VSRAPNYTQPLLVKYNRLFSIVSRTKINCNVTLTNKKKWVIYTVNDQTGRDTSQFSYNDPSITTSRIVVKAKKLPYGLYRLVYTVGQDCLYSEIDTFVRVQPSGLMISTLWQKAGVYGGLIEITRSSNQKIRFSPFVNTYDLDSRAVISSLTFKYSCQVVDSNIPQGYPKDPQTNNIIYLDEFKFNGTINKSLLQCFNTTGKK